MPSLRPSSTLKHFRNDRAERPRQSYLCRRTKEWLGAQPVPTLPSFNRLPTGALTPLDEHR